MGKVVRLPCPLKRIWSPDPTVIPQRRSFLLFLLLALLLGSCGSSPEGGCAGPWVSSGERLLGSQAPNFILQDLAGEKVELARVSTQKPVLLVFWATWCPTCIEEVPLLNEWKERYPQLEILGVDVEEPAERVNAFAHKRGIRYKILLDQEGKVAEEYGLVGVPSAILLAKGGKVIYYGFTLPQDIEKLIEV